MPKELTVDDFRDAAGKSIFPIQFNAKGEVIDPETSDASGHATPKAPDSELRYTYPEGADTQPIFVCE
ncbi:MAG: hypothetical protein J0L77_08300 [Alphaproteobacteria bacterium]|nr:hypothetical protein [Alphaproteobacteria bacterium]